MLKEVIRQLLYIPLVNLLIVLIGIMPDHSAALAIIVLTIIIRLILLIPNRKAIISQQKVQLLQPKIDEIKRKYPDDKQKQAIETMALYRKENVNMFGSCLPTLIQFPVLIALYYAFRNGLDPSRQVLLYDFVQAPEYINKYLFGIDLTKPDQTYILPVLAGIIQFAQTKMLLPKMTKTSQNDPGMIMSRNMTYMFPVMTVLIARNFAAALPLYWTVSSLFALIQQYFIMRKRKELAKTLAEETKDLPESTDKSEEKIKIPESKETKSGVELTVRKKS